MSNATGHAIPIARLREHISERGDRYFTGQMGLARIVIARSDEEPRDAHAIWHVFVQDDTALELRNADANEWRRPVVPDYVLPDPL